MFHQLTSCFRSKLDGGILLYCVITEQAFSFLNVSTELIHSKSETQALEAISRLYVAQRTQYFISWKLN